MGKSLFHLAANSLASGLYGEALELCEEADKIFKRIASLLSIENDADMAANMILKARILLARKKTEQGAAVISRAGVMTVHVAGESSLAAADCLLAMCELELDANHPSKVLVLLSRCSSILSPILGAVHPLIARVCTLTATAKYLTGDIAGALVSVNESLDMQLNHFPSNHSHMAEATWLKARLLHSLHDYNENIKFSSSYLSEQASRFAPPDFSFPAVVDTRLANEIKLAESFLQLSAIAEEFGLLAEALPTCLKALEHFTALRNGAGGATYVGACVAAGVALTRIFAGLSHFHSAKKTLDFIVPLWAEADGALLYAALLLEEAGWSQLVGRYAESSKLAEKVVKIRKR